MPFALSVLDLSPIPSRSKDSEALRNTLDLAQLADELGYHRYWLAEHHSMIDLGSIAPEIGCKVRGRLLGHRLFVRIPTLKPTKRYRP